MKLFVTRVVTRIVTRIVAIVLAAMAASCPGLPVFAQAARAHSHKATVVLVPWKTIPSWFIFGSLDKNIPPAAQSFMAKRAGAKRTVEVKGASHVVMSSHPAEVASLIQEAATATAR
jgi:pimeloyl-ACP methyl ester carboxylesterase